MNVIALEAHPPADELVAYVSDTLGPRQTERLESHVFDCPRCAERLEQAARFQMLLHDAATAEESEVVPLPSLGGRVRKRMTAAGGLWAAAAAFALVIWQQHADVSGPEPGLALVAGYDAAASDEPDSWVTGCSPADRGCSDALLAGASDPIESIDPLSSWPDDPLVRSGWADAEPAAGEPCGSGEDGGPLVCETHGEPISG